MKKNIRAKDPSKTIKPTAETRETGGIDLGDKVSRYCLLNEGGEVIEEGTFRNTEISIQKSASVVGGERASHSRPEHSRAGSAAC